MNNAKYKANELVYKFNFNTREQAIQSAIIAVNLILEEYCNDMSFDPSAHYWIEVKEHLEEML